MNNDLDKKIEKKIEEMLPFILERYKIYSKEELLTREEFLEALKHIDRRFEAIDRRFEALQQQMDKRFEAIDKRFEASRQEMDKRFEALQQQIDKRFEALQQEMDKRFEALQQEMDKRFEASRQEMDKRFEASRQEMDKRFEVVNKRFEAMDKRFEAMDKRFEALFQEMHHGFNKMHVILTSFGARSGVRLEKTIVNLAKKALEERQIDITKIEYNKEIIDDGSYFEKGYKTHIDMYAHNSQHIFLDIKYKVDLHDMYDFIKRIKLAENFLKVKSSKNIIIALEISDATKKEAERRRLEVISID
ncbi:MAG: hypothetical protein ACTSYB_07365 [Candidatus Helarchaeota archaeon]